MEEQRNYRLKTPPKLSELEWEILKPLRKQGPLAARDIFKRVPENYEWAYKTVKTMLSRLVKKGALTYDRVGNSYLYRAVYTREEMTRAATGSFIARVFDGALNPFMAYFAEHVSEDELKVLRAELRRIEARRQEEDNHD
jgi:BlaI family penicillinase repressor